MGAGGRVDEVGCDFADGVPAVVDVGGLVDEEEIVDYLWVISGFFRCREGFLLELSLL